MAFALGIQYLTGYSVAATRPGGNPEWPPHPARVFMALAAAYFENPGDPSAESKEAFEQSCQQEREILQWLESLEQPPSLYASDANERNQTKFFVPVNDIAIGEKTGSLQCIPGWTRNKQPRTFPRVRPHEDRVFLVWDEDLPEQLRPALERVCRKVTRIGHSSSLVRMWVADPAEVPEPNWRPDNETPTRHLRAISPGFLERLEALYGEGPRQRYRALQEELQRLRSEIGTLKGRGVAQRKAQLQIQLSQIQEQFSAMGKPPPVVRPTISLWQGYSRPGAKVNGQLPGPIWDSDLLVLRMTPIQSQFRRLDLLSTLQVTGRFREAILRQAHQELCGCQLWEEGMPPKEKAAACWQRLPEWLTGHTADGRCSESPHVTFLPLAFVGREHADGHLMGVAIGIPTLLDRQARRVLWQSVEAVCQAGLRLGRLGLWRLEFEDRELPPYSLRNETWTAAEQGATGWATVTPVAFDTHPKTKDSTTYQQLLARMIRDGCRRIGLPEPSLVVCKGVSAHLGVPPSWEFPPLLRKDGSSRRHIHVWMRFAQPVRGPIAIGAGRYRGYGFFRPIGNSEEQN